MGLKATSHHLSANHENRHSSTMTDKPLLFHCRQHGNTWMQIRLNLLPHSQHWRMNVSCVCYVHIPVLYRVTVAGSLRVIRCLLFEFKTFVSLSGDHSLEMAERGTCMPDILSRVQV